MTASKGLVKKISSIASITKSTLCITHAVRVLPFIDYAIRIVDSISRIARSASTTWRIVFTHRVDRNTKIISSEVISIRAL